MLIVFGGLPGTGKSTISKLLAAKNAFAYVRIDEIENALVRHGQPKREIGADGYHVGFAVSLSNLRLGNSVVADSVNPVSASREGWSRIADEAGAAVLEVECICSDIAEHQRRVERRAGDVPGWRLPSWNEVRAHEYEPWAAGQLVIDTALVVPEEAVGVIEARIAAIGGGRR